MILAKSRQDIEHVAFTGTHGTLTPLELKRLNVAQLLNFRRKAQVRNMFSNVVILKWTVRRLGFGWPGFITNDFLTTNSKHLSSMKMPPLAWRWPLAIPLASPAVARVHLTHRPWVGTTTATSSLQLSQWGKCEPQAKVWLNFLIVSKLLNYKQVAGGSNQ